MSSLINQCHASSVSVVAIKSSLNKGEIDTLKLLHGNPNMNKLLAKKSWDSHWQTSTQFSHTGTQTSLCHSVRQTDSPKGISFIQNWLMRRRRVCCTHSLNFAMTAEQYEPFSP